MTIRRRTAAAVAAVALGLLALLGVQAASATHHRADDTPAPAGTISPAPSPSPVITPDDTHWGG